MSEIINVLGFVAAMEGSLFTEWGPCTDGTQMECLCPSCQNANRIEAAGLDWEEEYQKARARGYETTPTEGA